MIFFYGLVGSIVLVDQLSKFFALRYLSLQTSVPVIPQFLDLTLVHNRGVAFGLFSGYAPALFTVITVSLVFLFFIANRSKSAPGTSTADRWALSLILGGAIGNWIDRLRFGAVIDFLDFRIWPVFNIADAAITIGVSLYLIRMLTSKDKPHPPSKDLKVDGTSPGNPPGKEDRGQDKPHPPSKDLKVDGTSPGNLQAKEDRGQART